MLKKQLLPLCIFLFMSLPVCAQLVLEGNVYDGNDSTALPYTTLIAKYFQSNTILGYTTSDAKGRYRLPLPTNVQNIITLQANHLGYHPFAREIVLGDTSAKTIKVPVYLMPNVVELTEVIVNDPIIVKKDTVIYDISYFTKERDETLEDVLKGLKGFKILADGTIEVQGQTVDKVLVNGEEISDQGAAQLTRSLSPENVASVEVRFDEQNNKLKESLIDTRKYVVLDIKLAKGLENAIFGKVQSTLGHQSPNAFIGGYANIFKLGKKWKTQFFGEHDDFGELNIDITDIKNLGAESMKAIFTTPADFNELKQRNQFDVEINGLQNNFTKDNKNIVGLSNKYTISPKVDIYFGTYNSYSLLGEGRNFQQFYTETQQTDSFNLLQDVESYDSKNKLDIRFDTDKTKIRLDMNAVLFQNNFNSQQRQAQSEEDFQYEFEDSHRSFRHYHNLKAEHLISKKWGISLNANYANDSDDIQKGLNHNNPAFGLFFSDIDGQNTFIVQQNIEAELENIAAELSLGYRAKRHKMKMGLFYEEKHLSEIRKGKNEDTQTPILLLKGSVDGLSSSLGGAFMDYRITLGNWDFNSSARFVESTYPGIRDVQEEQLDLFYKVNVNYSPGNFQDFSINFSKQLTPAPLRSVIQGATLSNFQTLVFPSNELLPPTDAYVFMVTATTRWQNIGLTFEPALLYGSVNNGDLFTNILPENLIIRTNAQLLSDYTAVSLPITKTFKKAPISMIFEPEWLRNRMENSQANTSFFSITDRFLVGLKLNTTFDKPYNLRLYPKHTTFIFRNDFSEFTERQTMLSFNSEIDIDLFDKKVLVTLQQRSFVFRGNTKASFTNLGLNIQGKTNTKFSWFLIADNLLNSSDFVKQDIFPTYFNAEQIFIFSRYVKVGLSLKII